MEPNTEVDKRRMIAVQYPAAKVISCAQNLEDVLINRAFLGKANGFYIDIGAGDPNWDSVTNWFYRLGWRGVNVEPNPIIFETLRTWRTRDINLNMGIAAETGTLTYYRVQQNELGHGWGLSSFDKSAAQRAARMNLETQEIVLPVRTLGDVVDEHCTGIDVDFLKIDVEGYERQVISSADFSRFRPKLICVESVLPNSSVPSFSEWEDLLINHGYKFALFDGVNNYYVREDMTGLYNQLSVSVNCNDNYVKCQIADFVAP